ncbi:hypothetical protein PV08_04215 [Exophiala spinifera]|uniref:Uncharacterized protein n=1 Tax=Exophiala spinifera TaxID=91928 RepID=A0A0D2C0B9_9EURO|nr:uncharacterized protein PV08_04215 [Exophiala spinifera]KIW17024.1 hypothetical protein PV08_04215 [Exophiala spinifera]
MALVCKWTSAQGRPECRRIAGDGESMESRKDHFRVVPPSTFSLWVIEIYIKEQQKRMMELSTNEPERSVPASPPQGGEQTEMDAVTAVNSSPLPTRSRHAQTPSITKKRTNDEVYEPVQSPIRSPTALKASARHNKAESTVSFEDGNGVRKPNRHGIADDLRDSEGLGSKTQTIPGPEAERGHGESQASPNHASEQGLARRIERYQQELQVEFDQFQQSLAERDRTAELELLDWEELESRYQSEIQPKMAAEQEIMDEFQARFQASETCIPDAPKTSLTNRALAIHAVHASMQRLRGGTSCEEIKNANCNCWECRVLLGQEAGSLSSTLSRVQWNYWGMFEGLNPTGADRVMGDDALGARVDRE